MKTSATPSDPSKTAHPRFRPILPEDRDQGDPYLLAPPPAAGARWRYYVYTTGEDPADGRAFPVYGSNDLAVWEPFGEALEMVQQSSHWAPCVRYLPRLDFPYVMLYSRAVGIGEQGHVGHVIRRAHSPLPEGPFVDSGHVLTPDLDFAIDPDVYRLPDGTLTLAFATDSVEDEPYGTGIVEADLSEDLTALRSAPRLLARPRHDWHVYDPARACRGRRSGASTGNGTPSAGTRWRPRSVACGRRRGGVSTSTAAGASGASTPWGRWSSRGESYRT